MTTKLKNTVIFLLLTVLNSCVEVNFNEFNEESEMQNIDTFGINITNPYDYKITANLFSVSELNSANAYIPSSVNYSLNNALSVYANNNKIYVATYGNGIWVKDEITGTVTIYNTSNTTSLPSDFCRDIYFNNNKIYVATIAGVWILDLTTSIETVYNTGNSTLPDDNVTSIFFFQNTIYSTTFSGGIWIKDLILLTEIIYNSGNSTLPSDFCRDIYFNNNKIYVAVSGGVWIKDNTTTIETVYNISNSILPNNLCRYIFNKNNKIYVGTINGLWVKDEVSNLETVYKTNNSKLPDNQIDGLYESNNMIYVTTPLGIWIKNEIDLSETVYDTSNSILPDNICNGIYESNNNIYVCSVNYVFVQELSFVQPIISGTGNYTQFVNSLNAVSYHFDRVKLIFNNNIDASQMYNRFTKVHVDTYGETNTNPDYLGIYAEPKLKNYVLDMPLDCIIGFEDYLQYELNPNISFQMVFYYDKKVSAQITEEDTIIEENNEIKPIQNIETKQQNISESGFGKIGLIIAGFFVLSIAYEIFKKKK